MKRLLLAVTTATAVCAFALPAVADPGGELVYADGQTYLMNTATLVTNASPGLLKAPPIYILGYATAPGTSGPITLPSGYQPQCNPCSQEPVAYHDHLIPGAPGLGTNGTSRNDYKAPWRIVVMRYSPAYSNSHTFHPITSDDQLAAAEQSGEFLPINPAGPNHYEIWTPNVLICPIVRQNRG